jgi:biotin synthase
LFEEGARAVLLRFETSNETIFNKLKPQASLPKRVELIRYLKELGYVLATGFLIGLPEEAEQDIINNILLTKELKPDMYSLGPLIPTKHTPLENHAFVDKNTLLKVIALCRFIDKDSNILVTTALETLDKGTKRQALLSGANSLMVNVTPAHYRSLYHIYDNRAGVGEPIEETIRATIELLYSLGRAPTDLGIKTT